MPYTSRQRYPDSYKIVRDGEKKGKPRLHRRIIHHVIKHHKMRKVKEENLPAWKEKWNNFNETRLGWLEHFVEKALPWLVLLLGFIVIGEFTVLAAEYGYRYSFFGFAWTDEVEIFFSQNAAALTLIDQIIVSFFAIDLYFNFFKKRTTGEFLRSSFIDILAIAPLGLIIQLATIGEAQSALHLADETGKEAIKIEREAAAVVRAERLTRITEAAEKLPKFFRLNRLKYFSRKKSTA